ncbi:MAG: tRNA/rRNA methyltransferase (SpoU) [Berkelbacteria bacterium GW2011_GWA2_35_9]|uniref:tRNA/rRNA methyltransferase (SpoU) n=1 Tax=Berkelbacteria bacterium GW2011_GWA2_35_9 TaxID=1618333 RepID=A0A0G0D4P7_9BACT|nr:MAG: tRNA/rRNA methyltransferase (SpoU) [Berkelbacteria bacterium GW2011_GWA2_35_9]
MNKLPIILVLDNIRSLYNVGAILRTADACNIEKVVLCGMTGTDEMKNPSLAKIKNSLGKIEKTAIGAEKSVMWEYHKDILEYLSKISKTYQIISLELTGRAEQYNTIKYQFPLALVVGHEIKGVDKKILKLSDNIIMLPMLGKKNSLNVSVATGVALYYLVSYYQKTVKK